MRGRGILGVLLAAAFLSACAGPDEAPAIAGAASTSTNEEVGRDYLIGPGDQFQVFVWRNPDLSTTVRVRPDGRISVPLIDDLPVAGRRPSEVARTLEEKLSEYIQDAKVTVILVDFVGPIERQVRVVGEAAKPQALSYRKGMTVLDVMIATGGLTQFAAGNRATLSRTVNGYLATYRVRLADLLNDGDLTANVEVAPGDVVMIPQSWF